MRAALRLFLFRLAAGLVLTVTAGLGWAAPHLVIITSSSEGAYGEASTALRSQLQRTMPWVEIEEQGWEELATQRLEGSRMIVTIGTQAARVVAGLAPRQPVLHTLLPNSAFARLPNTPKTGGAVSAILLDQPAERQIALIRLALPDWKRIALLTGSDSEALNLRLAELARERQLEVREANVTADRDLYPALQRVLAEPAVLIASPDAQVFNSFTVQNVLLTAYRHRSPVVGFSSAYVRAGALLGLYSTPEQIGHQAADTVQKVFSGEALPPARPPRQFEVAVNTNVARSLGIQLDSAERLGNELARREGRP